MTGLGIFRTVGREPGRATLMARGAAFLTMLVVIVGSLLLYGGGRFSEHFRTSALVDNAGGSLISGADVKYDGVIVGKVTDVRRSDAAVGTGHPPVELALDLNPDLVDDVPGNVVARVLPASVFGTSFLDLRTPGAPAGQLAEGRPIDQDRSAETLEIQELLDSLDEVVDSLGPAELSTALNSLAAALDGNGERLGATIDRLYTYLHRLNPQMPLVRRNLSLLARNLEAFEDHAPDLLDAADNALVAAGTLVEQEREFTSLVESGSTAFNRTADVLEANQVALADNIVRAAVVVDVLYDGRNNLVNGLFETIELARKMGAALSYGPWIRIDANLQVDAEPFYGPADCPTYGSHRGRGC